MEIRVSEYMMLSQVHEIADEYDENVGGRR